MPCASPLRKPRPLEIYPELGVNSGELQSCEAVARLLGARRRLRETKGLGPPLLASRLLTATPKQSLRVSHPQVYSLGIYPELGVDGGLRSDARSSLARSFECPTTALDCGPRAPPARSNRPGLWKLFARISHASPFRSPLLPAARMSRPSDSQYVSRSYFGRAARQLPALCPNQRRLQRLNCPGWWGLVRRSAIVNEW
jgi:hypothetical protein